MGQKRGTPCVGGLRKYWPYLAAELQDSATSFYWSHLPREGKQSSCSTGGFML